MLAFTQYACNNNTDNKQLSQKEKDSVKTTNNENDTDLTKNINGIKVYPLEIETETKATIALSQPINNPSILHQTTFHFKLNHFELGKTKSLNDFKHIKTSNIGQYIAFSINNSKIKKLTQDSTNAQLLSGNNCVLAFLCNTYGISLKESSSYYFKNYIVGKARVEFKENNKSLFYNLPEDKSHFKASEKVILDFFLINTELSTDGYRVKATIDGVPFILNRWCPYVVEGLKPGERTIRLELIDKNGKLVESPFNDSGQKIIYIEKHSA